MSILFGHPSGSPNSHHAALAHYEAGRLEALCIPWLPSGRTVRLLGALLPRQSMGRRFARRHFPQLAQAPKVQGRVGEMRRLVKRAAGWGGDKPAQEARVWLMATMRDECRRPSVTAVHAYDESALWPFEEAKRLGKACVLDLPTGYYPARVRTHDALAARYADWIPATGMNGARPGPGESWRRELELADLVLVPSDFVEDSVRASHPTAKLARAPYGVDGEFWAPEERKAGRVGPLRFLFAGQVNVLKGVPLLLKAWQAAALPDAELRIVGMWRLAKDKDAVLPANVVYSPPCSADILRGFYREADVFVLPSFFEGLPLALLEALSCGLPAIASDAAAGREMLDASCGKAVPTGDLDALVDALRWAGANREKLPALGRAARSRALEHTWERYRRRVSEAVAPYV